MDYLQFVHYNPECEEYTVETAYCQIGPGKKWAMHTLESQRNGVSHLCSPMGDMYSTLRVVHVDHEEKRIWTVYGNV